MRCLGNTILIGSSPPSCWQMSQINLHIMLIAKMWKSLHGSEATICVRNGNTEVYYIMLV